MAANLLGNADLVTAATAGTTAGEVTFNKQVNQVSCTNQHATAKMWVRVFTGSTAAAANTAAVATVAVASADENFYIPPANGRTVVFKSARKTFVALSIIADGATTLGTFTGTNWLD